MLQFRPDILSKAAALPLRDAALTLWQNRAEFIRAQEEAEPDDLSARARAIAYGRTLAQDMKSDRDAAPGSALMARLLHTHPDHSEDARAAAIREAVAFSDACQRLYKGRGDNDEDAMRAVMQASQRHPGYTDATLQETPAARHRDAMTPVFRS